MRSGYNITPPPSAELADGVVQSLNVALAAAGCVVLGVLACARADPLRLAALTVYGAGLLAMVGASALYAWGRGGRRHVRRRSAAIPSGPTTLPDTIQRGLSEARSNTK
jgi:predicted membrane channel-forming protein YqfA (hemolysin III family)